MALASSERTSAPTLQAATLNREELYELVWAEPVARIAERYGLSGAGLRKLCLRQGIPVPPRGHWAKAAVGKQTARPPLPPEPPKRPHVRHVSVALTQRTQPPAPARSVAPEMAQRATYEADPRHKIRVNRRRTSTSTWAIALQEASKRAYRDPRDLLKIRLEPHGISATIHQKSVTRLAHILAALEHACANRGLLHAPGRATQPTRLVVDEIPLFLHVGERTKRHEVPREPRSAGRASYPWEERRIYRHEATGNLTLAVMTTPDSSWYYLPASQLIRDTPDRPLEERLNDVFVTMQNLVADTRLKRLERQREDERRRAAEDAARNAALARQRRQSEIQDLNELAERRQRAELIRALVVAAEAAGRAPRSTGAPLELASWRAWALQIADELDPLSTEAA